MLDIIMLILAIFGIYIALRFFGAIFGFVWSIIGTIFQVIVNGLIFSVTWGFGIYTIWTIVSFFI